MSTIENFLLAAYKKKYGVVDNAVVRFSDDSLEVTLFAKKKIVLEDDLDDPVYEILLSEALELNEDCEVGDELLIEINPKEFKQFMGADMRLIPVQIQSMGNVHKTLEFLMGKNTPERKKFIVNNLVADVLQGA